MRNDLDPPPAALAASMPAHVPTVLTVDDEPAILSSLRRLLRGGGYRILQAGSGADGLALLRTEPVDVVISDMRMPEMDGAQFLEQVRALDPRIGRILLTGYADIGSTVAAVNRGQIQRYVAKPWDDQDLLLVVRDAMDRRDLERRHDALLDLTRRQNDELQRANEALEGRVAARTAELQQVNAMLETAFADLERTFMTTVGVFAGLLEMREGSAGHARRVAALARETARRLGLAEHELRDVYLGALLHDVGKIALPDALIGKPVSLLSADEHARYARHPVDGETALMALPQLQAAAHIVRQHHERVDGKGYPDGLRGDEIVVGARIVAAANDYDSLVHGGMSPTRYPPERARQTLQAAIGTHYDGRVVRALFDELDAQARAAGEGTEIDVRRLRPGMVLARDVVSPRGAILLAAGHVFEERIIRQLGDLARRDGLKLVLRVRDTLPDAPAGAVSAPAEATVPGRTEPPGAAAPLAA
jgi:response regulator RpfG family c-di-GMP phosphodiesterase